MTTPPPQIVPLDRLQQVLPYAFPWLQKAIDRNSIGYSLEYVLDGLRLGKFQLWASALHDHHTGFVISELVQFDSGEREVHLLLGAGFGLEHWIDQIATVELWAKSVGACRLKVWGRPGWLRKLRKHGYELETQVLQRNLEVRIQ